MKLVLIRHTSVDVPKGVCYGQTDVALNSTFEEEAKIVKEKLSGYKFDKVYSSPLTRANRLAEFCGYPDAIKDSRLQEINFGEWEMKAYYEIDEKELKNWFADFIHTVPPGGESVMDQQNRFLDFIKDLQKNPELETVAIFTHGGILINGLVVFGGKSFSEVYSDIPPYGSIVEIEI